MLLCVTFLALHHSYVLDITSYKIHLLGVHYSNNYIIVEVLVIQILLVIQVILWKIQIIWVPSSVKGSMLFCWASFLLPEVYSKLLQSCRSPTCVDKEGCCLLFDSEMSISV